MAARAAAPEVADITPGATGGDVGTGGPATEAPAPEASHPIEPAHVGWSKVMGDVQHIDKSDRTSGGSKFNYRGVDRVMNEVGPALRRHGVSVIPTALDVQHRDIPTKGGGTQHEVMVKMGYTIVGSDGSTIDGGGAFGEAADSSDKATTQAQSVAYRTWLLQALCIPTGDPEPDENHVERGNGARPASATKAERQPDAPAWSADDIKMAEVDGWEKGPEQRAAAFAALIAATRKLPVELKDPILDWGKRGEIDKSNVTRDQAVTWQGMIDAARNSQKAEVEKATETVTEAFPGAHVEQDYTDDEAPF